MMIRKLFFAFLMMACLGACNDDDDSRFGVPTEFRDIKFKPIPGGAVMRYYLPDQKDIFGVQVRYTDAWGEKQVKNATYLSDSLVLDGFTEAQAAVPAQVTFFNRDMEESEPMEVTFSTEKSATVAVFDELVVNPYWGGFNVIYDAPYMVNGMIHVFYIGTNPLKHEPDSILVSSIPISEGGDTLNFVLQQSMDFVDVVVRTDSYSGKFVKQRIIEKLPCLSMDTLRGIDFDLQFTGTIVENEEYQFGMQYLSDGDKQGVNYWTNLRNGDAEKYSTFMAGPEAFWDAEEPEQNRFIVDLREPKVPAAINLYAFLYYKGKYAYHWIDDPYLVELWDGSYASLLPSKVTIYGTNEDPKTVSLSSCTLLHDVNSGKEFTESWAHFTDEYCSENINIWGYSGSWKNKTKKEIEAADPVVLHILCNYSGEKYRYLIMIVEDSFIGRWGSAKNIRQYITINELEVCVKEENK